MGSYNLAYAAAWGNTAIGGIAGVLAAAYLTAHPTWLTADMAATAGLVVPVSLVLAALLPPVTRTPAARESDYLMSAAGVLPKDLAEKHPVEIAEPPAPPI